MAGAAIVVFDRRLRLCAHGRASCSRYKKQRPQKAMERGLAAGKSVKEVMREIDNT